LIYFLNTLKICLCGSRSCLSR